MFKNLGDRELLILSISPIILFVVIAFGLVIVPVLLKPPATPTPTATPGVIVVVTATAPGATATPTVIPPSLTPRRVIEF